MKVSLRNIKEIIRLSKINKNELMKLNPERAYNGKELTKNQLIYQIVFFMDAPNN